MLTINEHSGPYFLFCEIYGKTDQIEIVDETTLPDQTLIQQSPVLSSCHDIATTVSSKLSQNPDLLQLQYFNYLFPSNSTHTLTFLATSKHNILTLPHHRIVCVNDRKIRASYAFVNAPMKLGDVLVCRVLDCETNTSAMLLFGLTTCNPTSLQNQQLPEETQILVGQYSTSQWFVDPDISANLSLYDELAFWFDASGRVYLSINNQNPMQLKSSIPSSDIHQLTLYPFFDLYGQITSLALYNYSVQNKLNANNTCNARTLCLICCENLADTQLLPCQCIVCHQCAATIKRPSSLSDCPFDRKHITQTRLLPS